MTIHAVWHTAIAACAWDLNTSRVCEWHMLPRSHCRNEIPHALNGAEACLCRRKRTRTLVQAAVSHMQVSAGACTPPGAEVASRKWCFLFMLVARGNRRAHYARLQEPSVYASRRDRQKVSGRCRGPLMLLAAVL